MILLRYRVSFMFSRMKNHELLTTHFLNFIETSQDQSILITNISVFTKIF